MKKPLSKLVVLTALLLPVSAFAMDELNAGLKAGESIPEGFTATNLENKAVTYSDLKGENGLVLIFTRSAEWCPYCQKQMKDWSAYVKPFEDKGYQVAAITYDAVEKLKAFHEKNAIAFTLLSDTNSAMIKAFGILNTDIDSESRVYGVPYPAIYVIDGDGKITHRFALEGYKKRPAVDVVYGAVFGEAMPAAASKE